MPPASELDPLELIGAWDLSRVILDRQLDEQSSVVGQTALSRTDDGRIRWSESGTLSRHGAELPVSRTLYIEQRADTWFVTFEDGRDFHPWEPGHAVEHACSPDLYVGTVARLDADRWTVEWQVTGPSKDYTMTSILTRSTPGP